jgi:hypothetical protein
MSTPDTTLKIGWAEVDITPTELPVYIAGQFHIRVSEGIADPLKATALVLESNGEHVVFVAMDTVCVSKQLLDAVREQLQQPGLDPQKVVINATHTHDAPNNRLDALGFNEFDGGEEGIDLGLQPIENYIRFAAGRIAEAVSEAWKTRAPGGVAFGQEYAVLGRNRRWFDHEANATMYGLQPERFDHIEGYEDHSLNLLTTYDANGALSGLVVNIPCPSQEVEHLFEVSADFWHEARRELRARFGEKIFILPQVSAAGELTSHLIFETAAHERMLQLRGRTGREEIAIRIADAVGRVLPYLPPTIEKAPQLSHRYETVQLPMNRLSEADVEDARQNVESYQAQYEAERQKILDHPELKNEPRWYVPMTIAFNRAGWYRGVLERAERLKTDPYFPTEVHVLRLGEIAFATNQFEYYLDFGIQIKVKSPALQTFIVQLAGAGTYIPSARAAAGGGYGAVPASNPVGSEGGQVLADYTIEKIRELWEGA